MLKKLLALLMILVAVAWWALSAPLPQIMQTAIVNVGGGVLPSQISGLQVWFAADSGLTCTSGCSNGNAVTGWADKSINGDNLTCSWCGLYEGAQINGLPAVLFDGSADFYTLGSAVNLQTASTMFSVVKTGILTQSAIISGGAGALMYGLNSSTKLQQAILQNVVAMSTSTSGTSTNWNQINMVYNPAIYPASTLFFRTNRSADGSFSWGNAVTANETVVGENGANGGSHFNGYIAELIVYNRQLSSAEISAVESYLYGRYGL